LNSEPKHDNPCVVIERRSLFVIVLAFILPLMAVAGYRALERGRPVPPVPSVQSVNLAAAPPARLKFLDFSDKFRRNETVTDALLRHGLTKPQVYELVQAARPVWPRTRVIAGEEFQGNLYPNGEFHEFRYRIDPDRYLTVYRDGDRFVPLVKSFDLELRTEAVNGVILNSLFLAVTGAGEQEMLAGDLSNIFAWDVDFDTDIQKGDSFRILVEKKYLNGRFDRYGNILAAELTVGKKHLSAFRFQNEFYDNSGKSVRKSLLKSPLNFAARISSRYSSARLHPILRIVRPHYGVDYAAPTGTPVVAVASGKVISAGMDGGFGNSVRLRHDIGGLETVYSHLSVIGVRAGQQVAQGQVIGNVGATGLATGPHLDFRVFEHGRPTNPTRKIVPDAPPVAANMLTRFTAMRDALRGQLDQLDRVGKIAAAVPAPEVAGGTPLK
jgi:murein DD-endopeptidase MepM/ murein hydrolase activator NlpD